ncbi:Protein CBR-NAS-3 [Caenorhabditis briggsae]|uniref:Metalloendopeptidase n=1 Tax=Caenorhabditis briggsae TaxID=6238 RepID=A8XV91_CAEBR|nr:Protein CBR-NAS-3 [Caenorhabditis briggsae]CAP36558.2 Protein CBR-NAS-3 [Caenorhabditis briggsae]
MYRSILLFSLLALVLAKVAEPEKDDQVAVKIPTKRSVSEPPKDDDVAVKIPMRKKRGIAIHPWQWESHLWPNGEVPYDIASHYTATERATILSAMDAFKDVTCIRFRPRRSTDRNYLQINKHYQLERCFSYIGRQTSRWLFGTPAGNVETRMKLDPTCLLYNGRGTVMHELMHILGFYHEHQRDDRDRRIGGSAFHYNFKIYQRAKSYYMGGYDANSIMHYNFQNVPWQKRDYFSPSDIRNINTLYKCNNRVISRIAAPSTTQSTTTTTTVSDTQTNRPPRFELYEKKAIESNSLFRRRRS